MTEKWDTNWKLWMAILERGAASGKPLMEFLQNEIIESQKRHIAILEARVSELEEDKSLDSAAREQLRTENERLKGTT